MKKVFDKNGKEISIGMLVLMPDPKENEVFSTFEYGGFVTHVDEILDNGNIIVEDGMFEIEANRVEIS
jgi:hypothetical protein